MFVLLNMDMSNMTTEELRFKAYEHPSIISKFDLTLYAMETPEGMTFNLEYCTQLFQKETIQRQTQQYIKILEEVATNPDLKLNDIDIITEEEKNTILFDFNNNPAEYPQEETIQEIFEEQVKRTPDNVALVYGNNQLTYQELNEKTNQLAHALRNKGVKPDDIIGLLVDRSPEMIIAILAVLKAGGAYLPIDPNYPEKRIQFILQDSATGILLTQPEYVSNEPFDGIILDLKKPDTYEGSPLNPNKVNASHNLAYIIYTSGSTGNPKGVMVNHGSLMNTLLAMQRHYPLLEDDAYLMKTAYTFDVSLTEIFGWIYNSGRLILLKEGEEKDPKRILEAIEKYGVTHINFVPSMLKTFTNTIKKENKSLNKLKYVFSAGEAITKNMADKFYEGSEGNLRLENLYGPTEGTIYTTRYSIKREKENINIPIGKPLDNTKAYILDRNSEIQPIGIPGELCIAGEGLARGYLNNPELTSEFFVDNPFTPGERLYRTGDLARWLPDGNIEFLGRIDHQVKIRGYRIELGEIENQLINHPSIKETVTVANEDLGGDSYLCAYYVGDEELTTQKIRTHLSQSLPEYMIPTYFIKLDKIPLTPNGKIDRKILPEPDGSIRTGVKYIGPRDTVEEKLILLWQDILGVNRVGIRDTFFELGGHSLKATTLVSRIHKEFNVEFPLKKVFQTPTVAEMAVFIRSASKSIYSDIQTVEEREYYPMSSAQIRLYILDQFEGAGIAFNMPGVIIIDGDLDWLRFEESFQQLIGRHEILRTSFTMKDIEPIQIIHDNIDFKLTYMESNEEEIDIIINGFIKPFDLSQAPLLRVSLVKVDKHRHFLLFDMHHIISDGMSMNILIREFMSFYQRMKLPDLRIQYKDYSVWQNKHYREDTFKQQEKYWLEIFKDEIPVLNMPLDYPRPMMQSFEGNHLIFEIEGELTRKLNALAMDEGVTLYMVLLASLNILFSKYTGQDDIVIGSVSAGRPHSELENLIGLFINTLAMRNHPQEEKIFKEFLEDVKENALEAYENQDYQFDELIENLNLKRDFSRNPIFDVMFILQNMDITEMEMERLNFTYYENPLLVSKVDMLLNAMERGDGIIFNLEYCTKLFKKETIEKFAKHYVNILEEIVKNPYLKLKEINILTEEEKNTIFHDFNNTKAPYSRDKTIHELFEEQVERTPDNIALIYEDEQLTYSELNKKANQIAHILRDKGIKPDSIVGIMLERSPEMIIGLLAVLKAGGAYLPIDPSYPEERIMYILKDSAAKILLTQQKYESRVSFNGETLDLKNPDLFIGSQLNLENVNTSHDLSYVIYTSGSTGKPKGVMIEHYSVINKLEWMLKEYPITEDDVLIQKTPYTFDASVYELFIWSFTGARLCLLKPDGEKDPEEIINAIEKHMVTTIEFVPSMLSVFLGHIEETQCSNRLKSLKHVTTGGEALTTEQVKKFNKNLKKNNTNLINTYGPTETTIDVTYYYCNEEIPENIPIGKPISNIQLYIMDKHQKLQPITIPGELCISGDGLARGYLNKTNLTNKSFMNNPFIPGERLYRTGDLARWLPDGNIEFLGRIDHQVKIRGNRIELGEIENRLLEHPQITETVVMTKEDPQSGKYLCAYFIGEEKLSVPHLRAHLSKHLPDYMIPHYFIQLEKMPLNQNGKIDRKSLPEPDGSINTGVKYVAPRNEIEEKLVKIWQEILKVDKIGIKDDFFSLGGDSIKAIQVSSRLNSYGLKLEITEMLKNPVIEELSNHITLTTRQIDQSLVEGEVELTPIQKWFFKQSFEEKNNFNQAVILKNNREFVENAIIKALDKLVEHHDALRTVFKIEEGCVKQIIRGLEGELYAFEVINLLDMGDDYELLKKETGRIQESIDPENGPLLKLGLFKTAEGDYLSIIIHYLVVDDESWRIILEDLIIGYLQALNNEELKLSDKTDSLKRWSDELYDYANSKQMLKEVEYWTKLKECDIKSIPTDHTINEEMVEDYKTFKIELTRDQTVKLVEQVNEAYNTDINDILLTSLGLAVKEWTGADEVLIGMEGSSREAMINDIDINRTVGLFTAKYPVVLDLSSYNDISYAIKSTKETLRKIPNKGIGYGILKYLTLPENKEELDFNLKPEIIFNFMDYFGINNDIDVFKNSDFSIAEEIFPNMYTPCTIGINGMIIDEKLIVSFDYNGHKYEKSTIERITECFRKNLLNVVNHCLSVEDTEMTPSDFTIEDIELEELEYLQNKFNSIVEDE
ncbi:MAG: 3-hydroxypropionyl-coenzyme A synthetase [Methanobacterium sp. PtaU1.Bin242]|nr:MAG: 3-hydroxypropionyl-coenzyme A synthetase [Methanobacterium sp. PtaU1.Bin242]